MHECNPQTKGHLISKGLNSSKKTDENNSTWGIIVLSTGKFLSEALIFASTNPQYDDRLFIELQV